LKPLRLDRRDGKLEWSAKVGSACNPALLLRSQIPKTGDRPSVPTQTLVVQGTGYRLRLENGMRQTDSLESSIREVLAQVGTCSLEELNERLPYYSWNQVYSTVERPRREGTLVLQLSPLLHCGISLARGLSSQPILPHRTDGETA